MMFSFLCFGVGVSGSIYCVIRSAPAFGIGRAGDLKIFSGQSRDQYLVEGVLVAMMTLGAAMAMVLLQYSTKIPFAIGRHVCVLFAMSVFIVLSFQIWGLYVDKTRWYSLKETLPEELWAWISSSVKKSSPIHKRLFRLSEIWLFDYKDWTGFEKKAKSLVYDYVLRFARGNKK